MSLTVDVTIATWNCWHLLEQCLASLERQSQPPHEILIVDQGSTDGTAETLRRRFPRMRLLSQPTNTGYCQAQNRAIHQSQSEAVLVLNNDVVLHRDFLRQATAALAAEARLGAVGGKVLSWDARRIDCACQMLARSCKPEDRGYRQRDQGQFDQPGNIFGPGGAAALYRRSALENVAEQGMYFDERLGCFYEDLDLVWRLQRRGWRARYVPEAVAYHYRGATAQGPRPRQAWLADYDLAALPSELQRRLIRNRRLVLRKHHAWRRVHDWPWLLAYEVRLCGYHLLRRPATGSPAPSLQAP